MLDPSAVSDRLGYVPVNKAGDTLTGLLTVNGQIKFPSAQNASSDANTLDDYEEGTWTPTWYAVSGSMSYAYQVGRYVKIGKLVIATCHIITNANNAFSGSVYLGGLPFTSDASTTNYIAAPIHMEGVNIASGIWAWAHVNPGGTTANLRYYVNNAGAALVQGSQMNAGSDVMVTCTYMTT